MEAGTGAMIGRVVRAGESYAGKQGPNYTPGVSAQTVGSLGLWLGCVTLPPGRGPTKAHVHDGHDSALSAQSRQLAVYHFIHGLSHALAAEPHARGDVVRNDGTDEDLTVSGGGHGAGAAVGVSAGADEG